MKSLLALLFIVLCTSLTGCVRSYDQTLQRIPLEPGDEHYQEHYHHHNTHHQKR